MRSRLGYRLRGELWMTAGWVVDFIFFPLSSRLALVLLVKHFTALTVLSAAFMFWRLFVFVIDTSEDRL